jgi:hypothetical protein
LLILPSLMHEHKISKTIRGSKIKLALTKSLLIVIKWPRIPCQ